MTETDEILSDMTLRGIRLLRKTGFTYLEVLAIGPMSINPPKVFALFATGLNQRYHVFFAADQDVLHRRWRNPKDLLNHIRAKINKAALRLYKRWREADRRFWAEYWASPEGIARKTENDRMMREVYLPAINVAVTEFIDRSSETYKRFSSSPDSAYVERQKAASLCVKKTRPLGIRYAHSTGSKYF